VSGDDLIHRVNDGRVHPDDFTGIPVMRLVLLMHVVADAVKNNLGNLGAGIWPETAAPIDLTPMDDPLFGTRPSMTPVRTGG
jgi:hypothetical protein